MKWIYVQVLHANISPQQSPVKPDTRDVVPRSSTALWPNPSVLILSPASMQLSPWINPQKARFVLQ